MGTRTFGSSKGVSLVQVMVGASLLAGLGWLGATILKQFGEGHKSIELRGVADNIQQRIKAATMSSVALGKSKSVNAALSECVAKCLAKPGECMSDVKCPPAETPFLLVDAAGESLTSDPGGFVDDGGRVCDQSTNKVTCQWKSSATFRLKSSDTVAMSFKITYAPPTGVSVGAPLKPREWTADVPLSQLAAAGSDPVVTKSYVDAAVSAAGGGCFETSAASCGSGYSTQATQTHYRCGLDSSSAAITTYDSMIPCTTAGQWIQGHTIVPFSLGQTNTRICCPSPPSS